MMPHVGAETLARYRQGDLSPRKSSRISAHLAGCDRCSDLNGALAGVTTLLASAAPPPMPEHLTVRIQTALATEAAARRVGIPAENGAAPPAIVPGESGPDRAARPARHQRPSPGGRARPLWPRPLRLSPRVALGTLAAAAGVAVVAGGGYALFGQGNSSEPSSASAPAAGSGRSPVAGPLTHGGAAAGPSLPYRYAGQQYLVTAVASGTDYTTSGLSGQVAAELNRSSRAGVHEGPNAMTRPGASNSPASGSATFGNETVRTLTGCVGRIAAGDRVLLVDVARYQGAAAAIIVTEGSASGPEQIWVVGTGCSGSRSDVLEHAAGTPAG
jgi:hypothetical protein